MDKQNVAYMHNGILFSLKKEWTSDPCCNVDESWDYILSAVSQTPKGRYCVIPLYEAHRVVTLIETESRTLVTRGSGEGRMEGHSVIGREFVLEWWEVLEMDSTDDGCTQMWILNDTDMVNGNFYVCFTTHTKDISCGGWGDLSQILVLRCLGGTRLVHVTNLVGDPAQVIRTAPSGEL